LISPDFGCLIFEQAAQLLSFGAAGRALRRAAPALAGKLNLSILQRVDYPARDASGALAHAATIHLWSFAAALALSAWGISESKKPTPMNGGLEEEHMGLGPYVLNVIMALIGISIPLLVYAGCIMTRKKKPEAAPQAAPHYEFDRAA
jgi:hypothetical protein